MQNTLYKNFQRNFIYVILWKRDSVFLTVSLFLSSAYFMNITDTLFYEFLLKHAVLQSTKKPKPNTYSDLMCNYAISVQSGL